MNPPMSKILSVWIWGCAYLNCAGWGLSAIHELNAGGYAIALLFGFGLLLVWHKNISDKFQLNICWRKWRGRFYRPLPLIFLLVAILIFLGGGLYAPTNYDALTYRLPRMLNWLSVEHWFWIPTNNDRMNFSTTTWEWLALPQLALLRSDRGLFLINAFGFLLLPGLFFSVFRQVGVARKVAWAWMWILPLAYGYATQAGSIGNDFTGMLFGLISVHFGLRARRSGAVSDIWVAGLAAALLTGVKLSNLPLLLPCLVAVWPALRQLRKNLVGSVLVIIVAIIVSAAPTVALNQAHTGRWNGDPQNLTQVQVKSPGVALLGNVLLVLQQSLMPPVLTSAQKANGWLNEQLPASWRQALKEKFPRYLTHLNELPQEEAAALGLGITLLLLVAIGMAVGGWRWAGSYSGWLALISPVGLAAWGAALFFMLKMGSEADARLLLPYYPLAIVPMLRLSAQNWLWHFRAWRILLLLAALSVLPAIILSPARPLFPAVGMSGRYAQNHPARAMAQRFAVVYSTYAHRHDSLAPLREHLPADEKKIGFVAGIDDPDYSLWWPLGKRQVIYLQNEVKNSAKIPDDIEWMVVKRTTWHEFSNLSLEDWAAQHHARIVFSVPLTTIVACGEETWCLLQISK